MKIETLIEKVKIFLKLNRHESAEKLVRFHLSQSPSAELLNLLGVVFLDASDHESALDYFQQAVDLDESYQEARVNLSITLCDMGRYDQAAEVLEKGNRFKFLNTKLSGAHFSTGQSYLHNEKLSEAVLEFKKALQLNPKNHDARLAVSRIYYRREQWNHCSIELESLIKSGEDTPEVRRLLGLSYRNLGRIDDANTMQVLAN